MNTKIGKYKIEVRRPNFCTIGTFEGGAHGKKERGDYAFWTVVLARKPKYGGRTNTARALVPLGPGERFERMSREAKTAKSKEDRIIYAKWWSEYFKRGGNVAYVRPATLNELKRWLFSHIDDARHLRRVVLDGRLVRVDELCSPSKR